MSSVTGYRPLTDLSTTPATTQFGPNALGFICFWTREDGVERSSRYSEQTHCYVIHDGQHNMNYFFFTKERNTQSTRRRKKTIGLKAIMIQVKTHTFGWRDGVGAGCQLMQNYIVTPAFLFLLQYSLQTELSVETLTVIPYITLHYEG